MHVENAAQCCTAWLGSTVFVSQTAVIYRRCHVVPVGHIGPVGFVAFEHIGHVEQVDLVEQVHFVGYVDPGWHLGCVEHS